MARHIVDPSGMTPVTPDRRDSLTEVPRQTHGSSYWSCAANITQGTITCVSWGDSGGFSASDHVDHWMSPRAWGQNNGGGRGPARRGTASPSSTTGSWSRSARYSAWSITFGLPWWKGWGITYTESSVGPETVFSLGVSWGKTLAFFGMIGFSVTSGNILVDPQSLPASPVNDMPTISLPERGPPELTPQQVANQLRGFSAQGFASGGVGAALNISFSSPAPNASRFSTETGFISPGAGIQVGYGW